jgi:hypothetical protein
MSDGKEGAGKKRQLQKECAMPTLFHSLQVIRRMASLHSLPCIAVRAMLWGFGDDVGDANECLPETVETLEDCVMEYIKSTVSHRRSSLLPCLSRLLQSHPPALNLPHLRAHFDAAVGCPGSVSK